MGVDVGSVWTQFPFGETAALLLITAVYATAFHFVAVRQLYGTNGVRTRSLVFAGGIGFAAIAVLLEAAVLAYVGQPPTGLELILVAVGFLAMGLAGSSLSVRWLHRRRTTAAEMQRGTLGAVGWFLLGVIIALLVYRLVAGGLLLLLLTWPPE
jgi:hypothetical protein